jgi:hypothetical protein
VGNALWGVPRVPTTQRQKTYCPLLGRRKLGYTHGYVTTPRQSTIHFDGIDGSSHTLVQVPCMDNTIFSYLCQSTG